jgi:hypothetical protein
MALTEFQRGILRVLAPARAQHESFVAGGVALNALLGGGRRSRDLDLFHDTTEALVKTVAADRVLLESAGYTVRFERESPSFAEAVLERAGEATLIQWVRDSAFRFFPLQTDEQLGLTLHPFDLATNKVLAMAGRVEARDWIDLMTCHDRLQPLGYLVWAACGKDPGYGPAALLQEIRRGTRYTQAELDLLDFDGPTPDARSLGARWHEIAREAAAIVSLLPARDVGGCVTSGNDLFRGGPIDLEAALRASEVEFHHGRIGGAWPAFPA